MFDVHTHMLRPHYWGEEFDRNWAAGYGGGWPDPTPEQFDAVMADGDIEFAVIFGITARAAGVRSPTDEVAAFAEQLRTPNCCFMALDPTDPDWRRDFQEGLALGVRGIKLYPVMGRFNPADPAFDDFFRAAADKGLAVLYHMGASLCAEGDLSVSHPMVVDQVAQRFPQLKQVIAHMGHPWQRDTVQVLRKNRNVYADISGMWTRSMDGYLAMVNAQEWGAIDRLLFGSDWPLWDPKETLEGLWGLTKMGGVGGFPVIEDKTIETIIAADPRKALDI